MNDSGENTYRRFLGGDGEAMKELIRLYRPGLTFFVYGLLKDSAETEEIVEDCFVELVLHPKKYNFASSLKTYLFALARYKTATVKDTLPEEPRMSLMKRCLPPTRTLFPAL